jgi:hypothetical protein
LVAHRFLFRLIELTLSLPRLILKSIRGVHLLIDDIFSLGHGSQFEDDILGFHEAIGIANVHGIQVFDG